MRKTLAGLAIAALLAAGCSGYNDDRGIGDAPSDQQGDKAVKVWPGPDQFHNIGAYCIGEDAVYIHTREAAPVVVADSKNCDEGGVLAP